MEHTVAERFAQLYDPSVTGWPGEIDFYRECTEPAPAKNIPIMEVACGTGRVCLRLAEEGAHVVELDRS